MEIFLRQRLTERDCGDRPTSERANERNTACRGLVCSIFAFFRPQPQSRGSMTHKVPADGKVAKRTYRLFCYCFRLRYIIRKEERNATKIGDQRHPGHFRPTDRGSRKGIEREIER